MSQLERGLGLLIDRLIARRERRGRTFRAVALSAVLVEQGGTWREQVVFREALADPVRMRLALRPAPGADAGARRAAPVGGGALRAAHERPALAARGPGGGAGGAASRGDPPDARGGWPRCRDAGARGRSLLALPRAPGDADPVRGTDRSAPPVGSPARRGDRGRRREPAEVDSRTVDAVRESWLVEDRWWTERPLRRRYWEVVTTCGRDEVVFHDLMSGRWWRQR